MAVSSIWDSLAGRLLFILRGSPLAYVTRAGVHKDRLARTGALKACAVSALARKLEYFRVWVDEFPCAHLGE